MDHEGMLNEFRDTRRRLDALEQGATLAHVYEHVHREETTSMCNCKSPSGTCPDLPERNFGSGPAEADYAGNTGGHWRPIAPDAISVGRDVSSEDLKEMDDEEIAEFVADAAEDAAAAMREARDAMNEEAAVSDREAIEGLIRMTAHAIIDACPLTTRSGSALSDLYIAASKLSFN